MPLAPRMVCAYVRRVSPCLPAWYEAGIGDLRAVTGEHVREATKALTGDETKSLATSPRSVFHVLKRGKLIFRDLTHPIVLSGSRNPPVPLVRVALPSVPGRTTSGAHLVSAVPGPRSSPLRTAAADHKADQRAEGLKRAATTLAAPSPYS